jgi:hypothetical protein
LKNFNEPKLPRTKANESGSKDLVKEQHANADRNGVKEYFKSLFQFRKRENHLKLQQPENPTSKIKNQHKNESSQAIQECKSNEALSDEIIQEEKIQLEVVEHTDLPHRFLTVKNKDIMFFDDYRKRCIKNSEQFKLFLFYVFYFS